MEWQRAPCSPEFDHILLIGTLVSFCHLGILDSEHCGLIIRLSDHHVASLHVCPEGEPCVERWWWWSSQRNRTQHRYLRLEGESGALRCVPIQECCRKKATLHSATSTLSSTIKMCKEPDQWRIQIPDQRRQLLCIYIFCHRKWVVQAVIFPVWSSTLVQRYLQYNPSLGAQWCIAIQFFGLIVNMWHDNAISIVSVLFNLWFPMSFDPTSDNC